MLSIENVSKVSKLLVLAVICTTLKSVQGDCDICHAEYSVACHSETVYSLCTDGVAKRDYITCPKDHVCTDDFLVCYHKNNVAPSCPRKEISPTDTVNQCGICSSANKVFSCIDETTIAFCYGKDVPNYNSVAKCPENTVCDLNNSADFCSESPKVLPSCRKTSPPDDEVIINTTTTELTTEDSTTSEPNFTTEEPTTSITTDVLTTTTKENVITTTAEPTITDIISTTEELTSTSEETTTLKITEEPTTETPTSTPKEPTTSFTTDEPITTTEEPSTPITEKEPTSTTDEPLISTTTEKLITTTDEPTTLITTKVPTILTEIPTTEEPTTIITEKPTTQKPRDAETHCKEVKEKGSYKPDGDTKCTTFVYCYLRNNDINDIHGITKKCSTGQYFDPIDQICQPVKPDGCD